MDGRSTVKKNNTSPLQAASEAVDRAMKERRAIAKALKNLRAAKRSSKASEVIRSQIACLEINAEHAARTLKKAQDRLRTVQAKAARQAVEREAVRLREVATRPPAGIQGDTGPRSLARGALEIAEILSFVWGADGKPRAVPHKVASRRRPVWLRDIRPGHGMAVDAYCHLFEKVASIGASRIEGGSGSGRVNDGGAAGRAASASYLRCIRGVMDCGSIALEKKIQGNEKILSTVDLFDCIAVFSLPVDDVLKRSGWPQNRENRRACHEAFDWTLERCAFAFGYQDQSPPPPLSVVKYPVKKARKMLAQHPAKG